MKKIEYPPAIKEQQEALIDIGIPPDVVYFKIFEYLRNQRINKKREGNFYIYRSTDYCVQVPNTIRDKIQTIKQLFETRHYKNGQLHGKTIMYHHSKKTYIDADEYKDFKPPQPEIASIAHFKNGQIHGKKTEFSARGVKESEYIQGRLISSIFL